jgi:3-oxoacyl-ACP reductase-like protein
MGLFNTILNKLGIRHDEAAAAAAPAAVDAAPAEAAAPAEVAPAAIEAVDVVTQLEALAETSSEKLNWKTSIVDLLKLLSLDSSLASRKELATELGCDAATMADSASMNMWLHKTVLQKLAENGGNIPAELL